MLWYKAWLETRWRFVFTISTMVLLLLLRLLFGAPAERMWRGLELGSTLLYCVAAIFLAGAGINTQTTYAATSGFHGSMLFTLSLPVSRKRLFFVRAGLGAIETCVFVVIMASVTLSWMPGTLSTLQALGYGIRAIICTMVVYASSVLLACILDEMWQFAGTWLLLGAVFALHRYAFIRELSPLRGMSLFSYPATAPEPWRLIASSLVFTAILAYASVLILQRKQY